MLQNASCAQNIECLELLVVWECDPFTGDWGTESTHSYSVHVDRCAVSKIEEIGGWRKFTSSRASIALFFASIVSSDYSFACRWRGTEYMRFWRGNSHDATSQWDSSGNDIIWILRENRFTKDTIKSAEDTELKRLQKSDCPSTRMSKYQSIGFEQLFQVIVWSSRVGKSI